MLFKQTPDKKFWLLNHDKTKSLKLLSLTQIQTANDVDEQINKDFRKAITSYYGKEQNKMNPTNLNEMRERCNEATPAIDNKYLNNPFIPGPQSFFFYKLKAQLTENQIIFVLQTMDTVCNKCWDVESPCHCTCDD